MGFKAIGSSIEESGKDCNSINNECMILGSFSTVRFIRFIVHLNDYRISPLGVDVTCILVHPN